jgi:radical SAM superfamily enzyme YgiQ (UPF0313 family)
VFIAVKVGANMYAEKATIVFIFPPYWSDYYFHYHLGVGYIQAFLHERGIDSLQYVPKKAVTLSSLVKEVLSLDPEFIGFTCYDSNYYIIKSLAHSFKKEKPDVPIIVGGPTATFSDRFVLEDCPDIDICVRGEGEETTLELIKNNLSNLEDIKGISFRGNGTIIRTEDQALIRGDTKEAELDVIPSPYLYELIPLDGQCGILTSRGCTHRCVYCNFSAMSRHTVRYHSISRVIAELKKIDEYTRAAKKKKEMISIFDDAFSLNKERAKEICRRIINEGINLEFFAETRADACDLELLELMRDAGIKRLSFGLESAVPKVLRNIKKVYGGSGQISFEPERRFLNAVRENVELAKKLGFQTNVSIIVGLPGETLEDIEETLRFVKELDVEWYAHNYLNIFAGTELYETYKQYGYKLRRSKTILPYTTIYPYNVREVQPLENANLYSNLREDESFYLEVVTGSPAYSEDFLNVFVDVIPDLEVFYSWLAENGTLPFTLFITGSPDMALENLQDQISKFVDRGIPIGKAFVLKKVSVNGNQYSYVVVGAGQPIPPLSVFAEISASQNKGFLLTTQGKIVFTITTKDDVEGLIGLVKECVEGERVAIRYPFFACGIKDECRWGSELCPALGFRKVVIDQKGFIRTCFNGNIIGELTTSQKEFKDRLRSLYQETRLRRGCDSCILQDNCSVCLFPAPLSEQDYCAIRRGFPELEGFVSLMKIARMLKEVKFLDKVNAQKLSMRLKKHDKSHVMFDGKVVKVKPTIRLIYIDENPYIVDIRNQETFRVNQLTAEILESLILNQAMEGLIEELETCFKKSRNEVLEMIRKALLHFEEKGFLDVRSQ